MKRIGSASLCKFVRMKNYEIHTTKEQIIYQQHIIPMYELRDRLEIIDSLEVTKELSTMAIPKDPNNLANCELWIFDREIRVLGQVV
jgi:hypothetical protein